MSALRITVPPAAHPSWDDLRAELGVVEEFPPAAAAEAEAAARTPVAELPGAGRTDLTALPWPAPRVTSSWTP